VEADKDSAAAPPSWSAQTSSGECTEELNSVSVGGMRETTTLSDGSCEPMNASACVVFPGNVR
jgi:hypothetical protein